MTLVVPTLKLSSGYDIPILGLGTWKSKPGEVGHAVKVAFELGYRHIDCAAVYGNEIEVGSAIKYALNELHVPRSEIFITSKLWNTKHRAEDVEEACKKTLSDLGLEYLDLYLIHWPMGFEQGNELMPTNSDGSYRFDEEIHPTETWFEMEKLVTKGYVRSIGVSNFNSAQVQDVLDRGSIKPVMNQIEVQPYLSQKKLIEYCRSKDILITAYSPLASPDRPWASPTDPKLLDEPLLKAIGDKYKKSPAQILIRWAIERNCIVIPKSVTPSRIAENLNVFDFTLNNNDMTQIDSFECNERIIHFEGTQKHKHYGFHLEF